MTWYHRTVVKHNDFTFGILSAVGITNRILAKNAVLFGQKINDKVSAFLKFENDGFRKSNFSFTDFKGYFNTATVDIVGKHNDSIRYGL